MTKTILEVKNLTKYYGKTLGVKNLSLTINEGEIFGFIGPNGAGKSTTIRSIMNLINKNEGEIFINGEKLSKNNCDLKKMIGYLPSEINLYDDLTVKEMLDFHESFYSDDIHKRRCDLVKKLKLDEKKKVEDLSLGNNKKLGIILALMHNPKLLILDEPTSGLDPIMQEAFYSILKEEKQKGTSILYSTHILSEIPKICDRVGLIKEGKLLTIENILDIHNNFNFVTIKSKDSKKIIKNLDVEIVYQNDEELKFKNYLEADKLIKELANFEINYILIEEPTLEDVFLHYYQ